MGLYGSPDLSKKYGNAEDLKEPRKKKNFKISMQVIVLILLYLMMIWVSDDKYYTTIAFVGVISIIYFIINFVKMVINLIKKKSVNSDVIRLLIFTALIIICLILD